METMDLTEYQRDALTKQNSRKCDEFRAEKFQKESQKHWDLFYKRNETRFFKDRHWTTREFKELAEDNQSKVLFEIGCGVGNFLFPLLEEQDDKLFIYAADISPKAIELVQKNPKYDQEKICAFTCDISLPRCLDEKIEDNKVDIASMIFVLSAIRPILFKTVLQNIHKVLKQNGLLIFRDYAINDMAMFRFKQGTKINDRHYLRQDGTTTYFFTLEEMKILVESVGFVVEKNELIERRTVNKKENVDVPRIFLQGKYRKI